MSNPNNRLNPWFVVGGILVAFVVYQSFGQLKRLQKRGRPPISVAASTYSGQSGKFLGESIGIAGTAGAMARMLVKGTQLPAGAITTFSTVADNQPTLQFHILAGDELLGSKDQTLGDFVSAPLKPAPRGVPRIEVTFAVAEDGAFSVTSKELSTGATKTMNFGSVDLLK